MNYDIFKLDNLTKYMRLKMMVYSRYFSMVIYSLISFLIIYRFGGYYILTLDMIFPIKNLFIGYLYGFSSNELGGRIFITAISKLDIIPEIVLQRIYLFLIIFISGISMNFFIDTKSVIPRYFAGILYAINPLVYIRFLAGQWLILLAYSIIPFAIKIFIHFIDNQNRKDLIKLILLTTVTGVLSSHILLLLFLVYLILTIFKLYQTKNEKAKTIHIFLYLGIFISSFLLFNSYWLLPLVTEKDNRINNIGNEDFNVFSPHIENLSDLFDIASMYGFWRDDYIYAKDFISYWQLLSIFIISLAIYGFIFYYKDEKIGYIVKALGIIGIIGFVLATGINGPFGEINGWLYNNTILKGFRDSHKFVAILVLSYSVLGSLGINKLEEMRRKVST